MTWDELADASMVIMMVTASAVGVVLAGCLVYLVVTGKAFEEHAPPPVVIIEQEVEK